jgi:beta-carotene 3-hydroxylase
MSLLINIACYLVALIGMEAVAWATHRWIMHGPLWSLHRSHHTPRNGRFELNDLFAVFFAVPAILMFWIGTDRGWDALTWAAAGVTSYGFLYAVVHDGLVHQRWPFRVVPKKGYLKGLVQAHRLHHAVNEKDGAVSFGFLAPQDVRKLKQDVKARRVESETLDM